MFMFIVLALVFLVDAGCHFTGHDFFKFDK